MGNQEDIINFVKNNGPILPAKLAKHLETNLLLASAQLSELVDSKKLKISNTKVGGSPVYYMEGQEEKLQRFSDNFNEKDKRAYDLLKEKKVVKDSELDPLMRVAIRTIKDFAVPLQVTYNDQKIIFWKWYLVSSDEAKTIIGTYLQPEKKDIVKEEQKNIEEQRKLEEEKKKIEEKKEIEQEKEKLEKEREKINEEKKKIEEQKKLGEEKQLEVIKEKKPEVKDNFLDNLNEYFKEKKIEIQKQEIIRKKSEIDFILNVSSVVGNLTYYCKAKNKKRISDSDLSNAFVQGQLKKLPVLMLITGELTKKAKELIETEFKTNIVIKKI